MLVYKIRSHWMVKEDYRLAATLARHLVVRWQSCWLLFPLRILLWSYTWAVPLKVTLFAENMSSLKKMKIAYESQFDQLAW